MLGKIRARSSYANVMSTLAVFAVLGGSAVAATQLPKNSVGTKQLKNNAVTKAKLKNMSVARTKLANGAVGTSQLGNEAVNAAKLKGGAVTAAKIAGGSVNTAKLAPNAVQTANMANDSVNAEKIGANAVGASELGDGAVTKNKLAPGVLPVTGPLNPGQTVRGVFYLSAASTGDDTTLTDAFNYQFPMTYAPNVAAENVIDRSGPDPDPFTTNCPGISGGNGQTPDAAADQLCLYITDRSSTLASLNVVIGPTNRLGFAIEASFTGGPAVPYVSGMWAATARESG